MLAALLLALAAAPFAAASGADNYAHVANMLASHRKGASSYAQQPLMRNSASTSRYLTPKTKPFAVDGANIPLVDFDIGESYSGLLPISDKANETRKLFFWFVPSTNQSETSITIWLNGGPGCSSLSGMLTENGPFLWQAGTLKPVPNPYSWTNLTNMLWIEQPVGVGYSQGVPDIRNEVQLSKEFMGFYKSFVDTFALQKRKVYITGESYAGFYVPYIANQFVKAKDTTYYNLAGIAINDPIIGDDTIQQAVTLYPYVEAFANVFNLNATFLARLKAQSDSCGYTAYQEKYLTFPPPKGPLPSLPIYYRNPGCDSFYSIYAAALEINPCFNIYHILDYCPIKYSVLGIVNRGDYEPSGGEIYFNRSDVKAALHAPADANWLQCTTKNVFGNGKNRGNDRSVGPANNGVLANVIEATNNAIIGVGDLDFLLNTNGTLLALQNVTWNGVQGLTNPPNQDFYVPYHPEYFQGAMADAGIVGKWVTQRGLTFYSVAAAGHELPGYTPGAAYRVIEKLLGRVATLGTVSDFTTQTGNFTGTTPLP